MLNVLDIFSGIGGFSIGLEAASMQTVAFCEINPFCQKILTRHWPSVPIFSDITTIHKEDLKALPTIDVIAGGFPCQDISVAGKQKGITAKRSGLWKEFARLINEIKPKYAIIENVANLRSTGLISVLQDLWEIGYDAEWHCIPASAFGAPHRRDRIWIIAHPACIGKVGLSVGKKETESAFGDGYKNVSDSNCKRLQRHRRFKETSLICTQEQVSVHHSSRGIKQWDKEPLEAPRLKDERLNPDWVEWLMGYPISWTDGGSRMQRLQSLGNAVVPLIPEFLGKVVVDHYSQ
ncbi:MAG: DNA (cytosine-5-)-methyltransferase [Rickettsiaceae bacterium]|nr:DNA (cytosine-5-)-methyltransferase [Rickettsiaceae bacterium]MCP5378442.1 DNA (cytosine-5-)-methyltransferase [Rickettsiaceae bacterium]